MRLSAREPSLPYIESLPIEISVTLKVRRYPPPPEPPAPPPRIIGTAPIPNAKRVSSQGLYGLKVRAELELTWDVFAFGSWEGPSNGRWSKSAFGLTLELDRNGDTKLFTYGLLEYAVSRLYGTRDSWHYMESTIQVYELDDTEQLQLVATGSIKVSG